MSAERAACMHTQEARARIATMTIHKLILGTGYSSTILVTGALHVQLHMDDVIDLFVDDVMMLAYIKCMGTDHHLVHKNSKG